MSQTLIEDDSLEEQIDEAFDEEFQNAYLEQIGQEVIELVPLKGKQVKLPNGVSVKGDSIVRRPVSPDKYIAQTLAAIL